MKGWRVQFIMAYSYKPIHRISKPSGLYNTTSRKQIKLTPKKYQEKHMDYYRSWINQTTKKINHKTIKIKGAQDNLSQVLVILQESLMLLGKSMNPIRWWVQNNTFHLPRHQISSYNLKDPTFTRLQEPKPSINVCMCKKRKKRR